MTHKRQFARIIDEPVDNLYDGGNPLDQGILIRITGGFRGYDGGVIRTYYSWTQAFHETSENYSAKPLDFDPALRGGNKNADSDYGGWWAQEASGNDAVPTGGSVCVVAFPSPTQDFLIFHYKGQRWARIDAKKTSGSTTWYTWTEMEPAARDSDGQAFGVKLGGTTGTEESGPLLRNPLFEINKNGSVPADGSVIVPLIECPVRAVPSGDGGYLLERPEAIIVEIQAADGATLSTIQELTWNTGTLGGTFKVTVTNPAGAVGISDPIDFDDVEADIEAAIIASGVVTTCTATVITGGFQLEFTDDFLFWPTMGIDPRFIPTLPALPMWSDTPYFFDGSGEAAWARIAAKDAACTPGAAYGAIADVTCGIAFDATGRVIGGYASAISWFSPFGVADPSTAVVWPATNNRIPAGSLDYPCGICVDQCGHTVGGYPSGSWFSPVGSPDPGSADWMLVDRTGATGEADGGCCVGPAWGAIAGLSCGLVTDIFGKIVGGYYSVGGTVTAATNANPIEITCSPHGLNTGDSVTIAGSIGNTAANGSWTITKVSSTKFTIPVAGNGVYVAGATIAKWYSPFGTANPDWRGQNLP